MKKMLALVLAACMLLSCCAALAEAPADATYTYNIAATVFPTNWSVFQNQTATDSDILDYISTGYYRFDYNETLDGYRMVPDLAVGEPEDVSAQYAEQFGYGADETARAWKITIRNDVKWQDGTPINAYDIAESAKLMLDPVAANYRADTMYSSNVSIINAQDYLKQGQSLYLENAANAYYEMADLVKGEDGNYYTPDNEPVYLAVDFPLSVWLSGNTLKDYVEAYGSDYFDVTNWETLVGMMNEDGMIALNDETYALYAPVTCGNPAWGETEEDLPAYFTYFTSYPEMDFSKVGYFAVSDYEVVMVLAKPCKGFELKYGMNLPLVNLDLYKACESIVDGVYNNTYGTSAETTMSYGPYYLQSFQADKQYVLAKNPYYYGNNDETAVPQYMTTAIVCDFVEEASTRLELFLSGKLDSYGLQKDDMADYSTSEYCYYSDGDSIFAMVFNPELEALTSTQALAGENINKTILTLKEFRMAMAFAMDRAAFCLATSPTNGPAYALYSSQIIADPENGVAYRATPEAKQVIVDFWGLTDEVGEGKMYATQDDAIASITGYDLAQAKILFDQAYDIAIAEGLMDEDDVIEIMVGTPNLTSAFYNNGYEFIVNNYTEAVVGTKLEGKITFKRDGTLGNAFRDGLATNNVDMLFGVGWTGSTFDPYNLFQVFVDSSYQYDPHYDATTDMVTIELDGVEYTASAYTWYQSMQGIGTKVEVLKGDETVELVLDGNAQKIIVLAALEGNYLGLYNYIPLMNDASAGLRGMQIKYFTEEYVFPMGRGGVRYNTYNYTDAEWDAYVESVGGTINYK